MVDCLRQTRRATGCHSSHSLPGLLTRVSTLQGLLIHILLWKNHGSECSLEGLMLKLKLQYFGHLMRRTDSLEKTLMLGNKDWGQEEKGATEDEMAGWHH